MLNVWEIKLEKHYADDGEDEWLDVTSEYSIVAPDYDSALATAKTLAFSEPFDGEGGDVIDVDKVRPISIMKGIAIDAVANDVAAQPSVEPTVCPSCGVGAHTEYHARDCEFNV